jgi:toxin ParE1/3/4
VSGYRLSQDARADLRAIWSFIAADSTRAADRFIDRLGEKFVLLAARPELGRRLDELEPGIRRLPVGAYLIFYRHDARGIEIVRVLHGARNIEQLFGPDEA